MQPKSKNQETKNYFKDKTKKAKHLVKEYPEYETRDT